MISNPELATYSDVSHRWPNRFTHTELLSLAPAVLSRLQEGGRVLELEVNTTGLMSSLARHYPRSQFIGLSSTIRSSEGKAPVEMTSRNLHFRTVERMDLERFRQVDLVIALGGIRDRTTIAEVVEAMAPGGYFLLREREFMVRSLAHSFASLHALRLPEDPGFLYYVARTA